MKIKDSFVYKGELLSIIGIYSSKGKKKYACIGFSQKYQLLTEEEIL